MLRPLPAAVVCAALIATQQVPGPPVPAPPSWVTVIPIEPPATPLPSEAASARTTRFTFLAYGDTRSGGVAPTDADAPNPEHMRVMDGMLAQVRALAATQYPVRFVLQSGDGVLRGQDGTRWNAGFAPVIERLTKGADVPYFFSAGNHDVTTQPPGDPQRAIGLHNTLTAISRLIPGEGSPRRLAGYPTYSFGFGNTFVIAFDSNIAADPTQLSWVTRQLEQVDHVRYRHIVVFFHHPPFSSGPHGGASAEPVPGTGVKAADRTEAQTIAIRANYMPLFRKHHVDLLVTGHDHLYDHWVEHYEDAGKTYRMDTVVTGGGGAPLYTYAGEPDLRAYLAAGAAAKVRVDHLMKPGTAIGDNPHHFVSITVDGDTLSLEVFGTGPGVYAPYPNGVSKLTLADRRSGS
jgi:hypothetical protein